jgi:hypothetical protein
MHTNTVSPVESMDLSRPTSHADSMDRPIQRRTQSRPSPNATAPCRGTPAGSRAVAAGSSPGHPAGPAWWILHRLGAPQPFPQAGLPTSAAPMVGDRTWRRCRTQARP